MPKTVLLDAASLGPGIDLAPIQAQVDDLICYPNTASNQVAKRLDGARVAIVNKVTIDAKTLEHCPALELICVLATGLNNIDLEAADRSGVQVANVTGYGTDSVAQHTLMMMLGLANRLPLYQADVINGRWQASDFFCLQTHPTVQLSGKHLVVVGQGELGNAVARLAEAFGMQVSFSARPGNERKDGRPSLETLIPDADVISLHCPLTPDTRHLIDERRLAMARPTLLLINCARGTVIDEDAALDALEKGKLGGLGVDVLPQEPPVEGHPLIDAMARGDLNLMVTPHNAWVSPEARANIVKQTALHIAHFKGGNELES